MVDFEKISPGDDDMNKLLRFHRIWGFVIGMFFSLCVINVFLLSYYYVLIPIVSGAMAYFIIFGDTHYKRKLLKGYKQ